MLQKLHISSRVGILEETSRVTKIPTLEEACNFCSNRTVSPNIEWYRLWDSGTRMYYDPNTKVFRYSTVGDALSGNCLPYITIVIL